MTDNPPADAHQRIRLWAISASLAVGAALMGLKFLAFWLTDSSAILSDALESIINVVAGAFALGSVIFSARRPDVSHPYGHGKIEYFSAGFEGALIILAGVGIFHQAWPQILHPHGLPHLQGGILIILAASLVNLGLGLTLVLTGKRTDSLVLIADGKHVLTDVYTSAGVLAGLVGVMVTGWYWLDGAVAFLVGLNILVTGARLVRQSFAGLMDTSDPRLLEEIAGLLARHRQGVWIDIHRLRARRAGDRVFIDFHLILPRDFSLDDSHREVKEVERLLGEHFRGRADILIHADPCTEPECPICGYNPCLHRRRAHRLQRLWTSENLTGSETQDHQPSARREE